MNLLIKYYDKDSIGGGIPDEDIPKMEYQRLFDAISETGGIAFQTEMQEIIRIVHEDFPSEELNLARQSKREYFKLFNEAMDKVIEQAQEISRLKEENERLRGAMRELMIQYKLEVENDLKLGENIDEWVSDLPTYQKCLELLTPSPTTKK